MPMPQWIKRSFPAKMYRWLEKRTRVKPLSKAPVHDYDVTQLDEDVEILMMAGIGKDPIECRKILEAHEAETAMDVIEAVELRPKPNWKRRFIAWARRREGSYPYDPVAKYLNRDPDNYIRVQHKFRFEMEDLLNS